MRQGYTLIEVLVSASLVSISSVALFSAASNLPRFAKREEIRLTEGKVFMQVLNELEALNPWIPIQESDTNFDTAQHSTRMIQRCYSKEAVFQTGMVLDNKDCFFQVRAFKLAVLDRNFLKTNPLAKLPMSRLFVEVSVPDAVNSANRKRVRFRRLMTSYLRY